MHRRSLFPLAGGVVVLLAFAPVVGGQPSLWAAESGAQKSTTTTMADPDNSSSDSAPADDTGADADSDSSSTTATTRRGAAPSTTATSAPGPGSGSSSANCDVPETDRSPAPQVGDAPVAQQAGEAGEVEIERMSETELRVVNVAPNDDWTHEVKSPSGPRVNVRFTRSGQSPSLVRFAASMDQAGQELHIRVTNCG
jgi:hypothetical protein